MKKKLLFMLTYMNVGGTEKAFLNLLEEIPQDEYDVTLLLLENKGGFMSYIPEWVHVEFLEEYNALKPLIMAPPLQISQKYLMERKISKAIGIAFWHLIFKITNNRTGYYNYILKKHNQRLTKYDAAIAYAGPMDFISVYILNKVQAEKKVQWIHFDVSQCGFNVQLAKDIYPRFNKIYVVSDTAKKVLLQLVPCIASKTETMHNVVSASMCQREAEEGKGFEDDFTGTRILTVGRLSHEKGQDMIPEIVRRLKKDGFPIRWYLIGSGNLEEDIKQQIRKIGLEEELILLGTQLNPYPFYRDCDLYVQTSRHEGYCITIAEAKVFNKFVISTDVAGAREQIKDELTGKIVDTCVDNLYQGIYHFLEKRDKQ